MHLAKGKNLPGGEWSKWKTHLPPYHQKWRWLNSKASDQWSSRHGRLVHLTWVYRYMKVHVYACMRTHECACMFMHMCTRMCAHTHVCAGVYTCIHALIVWVCTHVRTDVCVHVCTPMCICKYTHVFVYIHMSMCAWACVCMSVHTKHVCLSAVTCISGHGGQETILEVILQELLTLFLETGSLTGETCK